MKHLRLLLTFILVGVGFFASAQTKTINYQAIIQNPKKTDIPGQPIMVQPLFKGAVCLKFSFSEPNGSLAYEETQTTTTDEYGLVNLKIGAGSRTSASMLYTQFDNIAWGTNKTLKVEISFNGCGNYTQISNQTLSYAPYALYAEGVAYNKVTGAPSKLSQFTDDLGTTYQTLANKSISVSSDATSDTKYPTVKSVKDYVDAQTAATNVPLAAEITRATAAEALKAPSNNPTFTGTVAGLTKTMVGLGNVENTSDANKPVSTLTQTALNGKANISGQVFTGAVSATNLTGTNTGDQDLSGFATTAALGDKVDKATGKGLSTEDYSTAEKNKLAAITGTNTGDQDLSGLATTANLNLKANLASPTFTGTPVAPTADATTNTTQIATTAFVKAATAGQFVDLTTDQTISGSKIFSKNLKVNDVLLGASLGSQNTMFGANSFGYSTTPSNNNSAFGFFTLASVNGGNDNTAIGTNAIRQGGAANGSRNTAVGSAALSNGAASADNVAIGVSTLNSSSGGSNTAVGNYSLYASTTARENVAVGMYALNNATTGGYNTALGVSSMRLNTVGDVNTAVGHKSLYSNIDGRYNTAIGVQAQEQNTTGGQNTAIGVAALDRNTTGAYNAVLGAFAGRYISNGSTYNTVMNNAVLVGAQAMPLANNSTNEIVIGYSAIGNGSNTVTLGNSAITNVKTNGTLTAGAVTYPKVDGTAGQVLTSNGNGSLTWTDKSTATGTGTQNYLTKWTSTTATGSSLIYDNGTQIGIGTSTPTGVFQVSGSSSNTIDQYFGYANGNMINIGLAWPGTQISQTFTAGTSGNLSKISVFSVASNSNVILTVYSGADNQGTLLFTSTPINFIGYGIMDLNVSNVPLVSGQTYTFQLQSTSSINLAGAGLSYQVANGTTSKASGVGGTIVNPSYGLISNSYNGGGIFFNTYVSSTAGSMVFANSGNLTSSGTLTAGAVTYPNTHGSNGQVLSTTGSGTLVWTTPSGSSSNTGVLAIANGGTGAATLSGILKGNGTSQISTATSGTDYLAPNNIIPQYRVTLGSNAGKNTTGGYSVSIGRNALQNWDGSYNTAVGSFALSTITNGSYNQAFGDWAMEKRTSGSYATGIGAFALQELTTGTFNTALGTFAGNVITTGSQNTLLGHNANPSVANATNQIVIGYGATGAGNNTIQLGNSAITNVNTSGSITANAAISNSEITSNLTIDASNAEVYKSRVLICRPSSGAITITFGQSLPIGFNCMVLQMSDDANKINLAAASGVTLNNRNNYTATAGKYAIATIVHIGNDILVTAGDMQ